ncbi:MAG: hypothetical protein ACTS78_01240 [Arsenophonus sp. NC-WZS1-MAG3]
MVFFLKGDLVVRLTSNSILTRQQTWNMVAELKQFAIEQVEGDLISIYINFRWLRDRLMMV